MIGKGATPSFFAIANDNYTLTIVGTIKTKARPVTCLGGGRAYLVFIFINRTLF